jgi:ankyrin repeat protein
MIEENKIIIQAVKEGNCNEIKRLMENHTFGEIDYSGNTILHIGACSARPGVFELILEKAIEKGVDLRNVAKNKWGSTPLDMAINLNNKVAIEAYRKEGIYAGIDLKKQDIEVQIVGGVRGPKNKEGSALHNACLNGSPAMVKALIDGGANIEAKNKDGQTPLHFAAFNRDSRIAKVLLNGENKLGVKAKIDAKDTKEGWSALAICLQTRNSDESLEFAETLLEYKANVNITDNDGCTPLMQAVTMGLSKEVKLLIQWEADTNIQTTKDFRGHEEWTALHCGAEASEYMDSSECIKILLNEGRADVSIKNQKGQTALDLAILAGNKDVIALLERAKFDTIFHVAARASDIKVLNSADSINVNSFNAMGNAPIHSACGAKENEYSQLFLKALIAKGGDVNLKAGDGYNPLQISAEIGSTGYINLLLENRADVNAVNMRDGNTALHYATMKGQSEAVKALLKGGANHEILNHKDQSAFDIAKNNKDTTIIELLNSIPSTSTSASQATGFGSSRGGRGRP